MAGKVIAPTLGIGAPFIPPTPVPPMARNGGMQVIKEPFKIVGSLTGKVYTTGNEDVLKGGKPEIVTIMPTDRPYAPQQEAGQQQALTGDQLLAMGYDPAQGLQGAQYGDQSAPQQQPQTQQPSISLAPLLRIAADPNAAAQQTNQAYLDAQRAALGVANTDIAANRNVIQARNATIAPQQSAIDAQGNYIRAQDNVLGAQGTELAGQRQFIGQQQGANVARQSELTGINAANNNVADKSAVAQAANARANDAYKYSLAGLAQPQQVQVNPGQEGQVTAPGTQAALETQGDYLKRTSAQNEQQRSLTLDQAKLAVQLLGTDTAAAQQAAAKVGLTVDEAQRMVSQSQLGVQQASNGAASTGLDVQAANNAVTSAGLDVKQAEQPPFPGAVQYTRPDGSAQWLTPLEAQQAAAQDKRDFAATQPGTQLYVNPSTGNPEGYKTPQEIDVLNQAYQRDFNISQNAARYGTDVLGGVDTPTILSWIRQGLFADPASVDAAREILLSRGLSPQDVTLRIQSALNARKSDESSTFLSAALANLGIDPSLLAP